MPGSGSPDADSDVTNGGYTTQRRHGQIDDRQIGARLRHQLGRFLDKGRLPTDGEQLAPLAAEQQRRPWAKSS